MVETRKTAAKRAPAKKAAARKTVSHGETDHGVVPEDRKYLDRPAGGVKTDKGGRPVMDKGGRPVNKDG